MSNSTITPTPSADEQPLRSETDAPLRVYRLPQLGAIRPAGSVRDVPPWEPASLEGPARARPVRDYYFA